MSRRSFAVVIGTRPEAIKLAPVIKALQARHARVVTVSTGQHLSLLTPALDFFGIQVDYDLTVMHERQSLADLLARILQQMDDLWATLKPDVGIVQGDTATSLGAGLTAHFRGSAIAHVEAGLRSFDDWNPFPEEVNRCLISRLARWHFCPTERARANLLREGLPTDRLWVTGNTVADAFHWANRQLECVLPRDPVARLRCVEQTTGVAREALERFMLVTVHRRENLNGALTRICGAVAELTRRHQGLHAVWPVHPNPGVQEVVERELGSSEGVCLIPPLDYPSLCLLAQRSLFILTDSGGLQEEAPLLHKPVLILREVTERPEIVEAGGAVLVGTHPEQILPAADRLLLDPVYYDQVASADNPFGDGHAADRIAEILLQ